MWISYLKQIINKWYATKLCIMLKFYFVYILWQYKSNIKNILIPKFGNLTLVCKLEVREEKENKKEMVKNVHGPKSPLWPTSLPSPHGPPPVFHLRAGTRARGAATVFAALACVPGWAITGSWGPPRHSHAPPLISLPCGVALSDLLQPPTAEFAARIPLPVSRSGRVYRTSLTL
jgi:hypothetical protein